MKINQIIYDKIKKNNNMITTSEVVELGFSKTLLSNYVEQGLIERVRQGTYVLSTSIHDDMFTLMLRSNKIVFSHDTAAFLNDISNRTPFKHSVTLPSDTSLPNSIRGECICYYIKPELYDIGIISSKTTFGNAVLTYNKERTICDILRSRNRVGDEIFIDIIKRYVEAEDKDMNLLFSYAKKFKLEEALRKYMEVLL